MIQFYVPDILTCPELPANEAGHCVRVLRHGLGDEITCVDGAGGCYRCRITEATNKRCAFEVIERVAVPNHWHCRIRLAFAPTKNMDRIEWMAEKCTEMGIDELIPVRCEHSERKELKGERLEKILVSAMKQSLKAVLPRLAPMTPLRELLMAPLSGQKFICYCSDEVQRRLLVKEYAPGEDANILIGPEGDFSPAEVKLALEKGWVPVSLGESRLRAETAGMYAVAAVHTINELSSVK